MMVRTVEGPIPAKSFFAVFCDRPWTGRHCPPSEAYSSGGFAKTLVSSDRRLFVGFVERDARTCSPERSVLSGVRLTLGDSSDFSDEQSHLPMASGALLEFNLDTGYVHILSSITGLPPIFVYEGQGWHMLTSSLAYLRSQLPFGLHFDPDGVLDLCLYGFPIAHRTLFQKVRVVPGGMFLSATPGKPIESRLAWKFYPTDTVPHWKDYSELQMATFLSVLRRMELKDSFLSLTGGLDTRTIFTALVNTGRAIPAYTLSGKTRSLDARTAHALCQAYGVPHQIVSLDGEFLQNLAEHTDEASRLSGGLASLGQAHQIYLYKKLPRLYAGRVSGNLGNHLGRKGVERVSMRGTDPAVLHLEFQRRMASRPRYAWTASKKESPATTTDKFLLQHEFPFTQLGNYFINDSFAVQYSPYASRDLITLCNRQPLTKEASRSTGTMHLRLRDLRHRFLGEPETRSFQRRLIHSMGGFAATYPINWGWRAKGGISLTGTFYGCLTAIDGYTERQGWDAGLSGGLLQAIHVTGLHEHRKAKYWMREWLRDFMCDTLLSRQTGEAGIVNTAYIERMLNEYYSGRTSHYGTLLLALDIALAAKNFSARVV